MAKKYIVFWRVKGGEPYEVYRGSDVIEVDGEATLEDLDQLADSCITSDTEHRFENLSNAVNDLCITICRDWKILKFRELKKKKEGLKTTAKSS